ncbi:MAG: YcaO-like family protein, partial [Candidatus Competibacteraceae bacterium]|nr:YcaO-like family protein [Candidatus Competibacteraceae bacterium]
SARASALMEAVETWHAERVLQPLRLATYRELSHQPVADIQGLPYCQGSRFHPDLPLLWVQGQDLLAPGTCRWLPFELVHSDYTLPTHSGSGCFAANTNGLASGNDLNEALVHALGEVIERDAISLWNLLPLEQRAEMGLDPASIDSPTARAVLERYRAAGMELALWEIGTDIGLPVVVCQTREGADHPHRLWPHPTMGSGCHPHREVALLRALTEAAQVRATFIAGSRDDLSAEDYSRQADQRWPDHSGHCLPRRRFIDLPSRNHITMEEDLAWILERLTGAGIRQVLAVNLTRPELGLRVVRVVVPGLEGAWGHGNWVPGPRARRRLEGGL